jgi:hypothetical protein
MLNLQDMANLVRIIDVSADKGQFKGPELSTVGGIRDRLVATIEAEQNKPAQQELTLSTDPAKVV